MGAILSTPLLGANTDRRTQSAEMTVGMSALDNQNRTWVYVGPAANAITAGASCAVTGTFAVNNTAGGFVADTAFASGDYGWVRKANSPLVTPRNYTVALTPAAVAANTTAEQTFAVPGLNVGDAVSVNKPTAQAGLGIVGARVSAANTLAITFSNNTAGSITPTAAENYTVTAF